ncbi:MAG: hypothetical protein A2X67_03135 [Ignavibacteria bacterium GWA2_55_11]|nr:MAG: hypothetical protein A2X67_03135 [Ignavibacteria bacterium GWA2_55_11]OGU46774.1 MAG: hypothetical protein A2X68_03520 [Ignavibacteria bacterium GWC2_56_12]OGU75908.1 MAG: hypothetical protein A3G43_08930 [Ignavibacteria bacterium RIFCSPLOWO2_12_FULL_56_21]HAV23282.1 hypothetical protein [Bacteroidota bacterium]
MTATDASCAVCGNSPCRLVSETSAWALYECNRCGFLFKVGEKTDYESLDLDAYLVFAYNRSSEVDEICACLQPDYPDVQGVCILEIGCATGEVLNELRNRGAKVYGVEPSHVAAEHARSKYGLTTVFEGYFERNPAGMQPEVFLLLDVIEHLDDPSLLLAKIASAMSATSVLVVKTGDSGSWLADHCKDRWAYIHLPQHRSFYCKRTLDYACKKAELHVDRIFRYRDPYGGIAWRKLIKNVVKAVLLCMTPKDSYLHRRLYIDVANDHLLAVIRKASRI